MEYFFQNAILFCHLKRKIVLKEIISVIPPPKHKQQRGGKLQKTNRRVLKQPKRYAPGAKALKEIRDLQKSTKLLVPKVGIVVEE